MQQGYVEGTVGMDSDGGAHTGIHSTAEEHDGFFFAEFFCVRHE
jgi:hypothetical protein